MVPEASDDPCKSIPLNPARKRERFLTGAGFTCLGQVLDEVSGNRRQVSHRVLSPGSSAALYGCLPIYRVEYTCRRHGAGA